MARPQTARTRDTAMDSAGPVQPRGQLPLRLHRLLLWVQAQESVASGPERRAAFGFTRLLIGGMLAAGYSRKVVADCLGTSEASVRNRAQNDGWLSAVKVVEGAGVHPATLRRWRDAGLLDEGDHGPLGDVSYPALQVVTALATSRAAAAPVVAGSSGHTPVVGTAQGILVDPGRAQRRASPPHR